MNKKVSFLMIVFHIITGGSVFSLNEKSNVFSRLSFRASVVEKQEKALECYSLPLEESSLDDRVRYADVCVKTIVRNVFSSKANFDSIESRIQRENVLLPMDSVLGLSRINDLDNKYRCSYTDIQKLALFAPGTGNLEVCVQVFDALFGNTNTNYEGNGNKYTFENALAVLFYDVRFPSNILLKIKNFFSRSQQEECKLKYIEYACGALRKYLSVVDGIEVKGESCKPYCLSIFSAFRNRYSKKAQ